MCKSLSAIVKVLVEKRWWTIWTDWAWLHWFFSCICGCGCDCIGCLSGMCGCACRGCLSGIGGCLETHCSNCLRDLVMQIPLCILSLAKSHRNLLVPKCSLKSIFPTTLLIIRDPKTLSICYFCPEKKPDQPHHHLQHKLNQWNDTVCICHAERSWVRLG